MEAESSENRLGHVCGICGKTFRKKYNLKMHEYTHSDVKSHQCQFCHKTWDWIITFLTVDQTLTKQNSNILEQLHQKTVTCDSI